jgi:hypothetical protein
MKPGDLVQVSPALLESDNLGIIVEVCPGTGLVTVLRQNQKLYRVTPRFLRSVNEAR